MVLRTFGNAVGFTLNLFALCFLISCGGGGGGGGVEGAPGGTTPTLAVTNDNAVAVAAEVVEASSVISQNVETTQNFTGAVSTGEVKGMGVVDLVSWQVKKIKENEAELASAPQPVGAVQTETVACDFGGTMTVSLNDADNNLELSAGDSLSTTMYNCGVDTGNGMGSMNGGMDMRINSISGDFINSGIMDVSVTYRNLVMDIPGDYYSKVNGDMRLVMEFSDSFMGFTASGSSFSYSDSNNFNRTMANYSMSISTSDGMTTGSITISGALTSSQTLGGTIVFETVVPFSISNSDFPDAGEIVVTGTKPEGAEFATSLYMTVLSNTDVQLEVDADGDGIYEYSLVVGWDQLTL
jgi:hypothetical protein